MTIFFLFFNNNNFYLYELNLINGIRGGNKNLNLENNFNINTMECDSFDGTNIFCVYSAVNYEYSSNTFTIKCYYSFEEIDQINFVKNELPNDIAGVSLAKIGKNDKKQFITCYVQNGESPSIFCQTFIQKENKIYIEKIFFIGQGYGMKITSAQFYEINPIMVKAYNYSIYILALMFKNQETYTLLYISSLDFGLIMPKNTEAEAQYKRKKDFLINDYYFVVIKYNDDEIEIYIEELTIQCDDKELFKLTGRNEYDISEYIIKDPKFNTPTDRSKTYVTFSLDTLTYLTVDNSRNMGELLNKIEILFNNPIIKLIQNSNLRISENYYIYHLDYSGENYRLFSNFCFLKVVNCYESCEECNINIAGTTEAHQCKTCKDGYNILTIDENEDGYFNCYKQDVKIKGYYLDSGIYKECDKSCDKCINGNSCEICKEGYFFKEDKYNYNSGELSDICYNNIPDNYFLYNTNNLFDSDGNKINFVYKKCYERCLSCFGEGNKKNNKCIECNGEYINYPFDSTQCTEDANKCTYYWTFNNNNNNIECISSCSGSGYIVHENLYTNIHKPQCVENCQSIFNPYDMGNPKSLLSYRCDTQYYCITSEFCELKGLKNNGKTCSRRQECFDMNDYTKIEDTTNDTYNFDEETLSTENTNDSPFIIINKIYKRVKLIKFYEFENLNFSYFGQNFIKNQTEKYRIDLKKELNEHKDEYLGGIDFITSTKYEDFNITIYPLQVEDYVYSNVFDTNNLCSVNFKDFFQNINYTVEQGSFIMVGLIEHKNENIPLNTINYFFFIYNENYNNISLITNLNDYSLNIDVTYPLKIMKIQILMINILKIYYPL